MEPIEVQHRQDDDGQHLDGEGQPPRPRGREKALFSVVEEVPEDRLLSVCENYGVVVPYRGRNIYEVRPSPAHMGMYSGLSNGALYPISTSMSGGSRPIQ